MNALISKFKEFADLHLRFSNAQLVVVVLLCLSIGGGSFIIYQISKPKKMEKVEIAGDKSNINKKPLLLKVHIAGEVRLPGLYSIAKGSRVDDAIKAAGGAMPRADLDSINLAKVIEDGQKIIVPTIETATISGGEQVGTIKNNLNASDGRININSASTSDLENLDGIGPVLSSRIIDYRDKNGPFDSSDQLLNVSGIGKKKLKAIEDQIIVE